MSRLLLVSGSTRGASGNTAALRAIRDARPDAVLYDGLAGLPAFVPDALAAAAALLAPT
jgi:hypothetical protein